MSGNQGAWGVAMWKDGHDTFPQQEAGISLEGGDPVLPYLPTIPVGSLLVPPAGLGVPAVRSGDVAFAQRDGVVQFADYYEARQLTFSVLVQNDDCPGCNSSAQIDAALVLDGVSPGRAFTPDAAPLDITGDLDIDVHAALDDWDSPTNTLVAKYNTSGNQRSYRFDVAAGNLRFLWSEDGVSFMTATSTTPPVAADGEDLWLRVKFDVDNGAGGRDIRFETSSDGFFWNQLGATVTQAGVTSIFNSTAELTVGATDQGTANRLTGRVFSARVRQGIDGPVVASPDFDQQAGTTSFVDDEGNVWTVVSPGYLQPFVAPRMSARQKVARLTQEWSRNCSGASLVLFTDCHDPNASEQDKIWAGPYLVHGRPRVADVVWERSNRGAARVTLRFDAADARLVLADTIPGASWETEHVQTLLAVDQNLIPDPDLSELVMTVNGATVEDSYPQSGGPSTGDGGPYFRRVVTALPVSSPMTGVLSGSGTSGIPVTAGLTYTWAWWARKEPPGGAPSRRLDWTWYDAGGAVISIHNGAASSVTNDWVRYTQSAVAPPLAAFVQPRLIWTGIPGSVPYTIDVGQAWMNEGATATSPDTIEVGGTLCAYPVFRLFPGLTAPIVITYGGHQFTYTEDVMSLIDIDTRWGRAVQSGVDVTMNLEGDYDSPLAPGVHEVTMQTGDPADNGSVNIVWENAVVSG